MRTIIIIKMRIKIHHAVKSQSFKWLVICIFSLVISNIKGQTIQTNCASIQIVGSTCDITVPAGYTVSGMPAFDSRVASGGSITYTITWSSARTYTIKLLGEPDGGAGGKDAVLDQKTITVYYSVSNLSISGNAALCPSEASSAYAATASNVSYFDSWTVTPSAAGTIISSGSKNSIGTVSWNSSFFGEATIGVTAFGASEDYISKTIKVNRQSTHTFTASINAPTVICEGQPFTIGVSVSYNSATYAWYEADSNTSIGSTQYLPVTPSIGTFYRVTVTPSASIPCLTNPGVINLSTTASAFRVKPKVNNVIISSAVTSRCSTDAASTTLTATGNSVESYDNWTISGAFGSPGTISSSTSFDVSGKLISTGVITWNPAFSGTATVSINARGCNNSSETKSYAIQVVAPPAAFTLTAPSSLCSNKTAALQLSSAPEANVTYSLNGVPGSSWTVSPGDYTVVASKSLCPSISNQISIPSVSHEASIQSNIGNLAGTNGVFVLQACRTSSIRISVNGGEQVKWYEYQEVCRNNNLATIPPNLRFDFCHKPIGTAGVSDLNFVMGAYKDILVKGKENVCQNDFEFSVSFDAIPIPSNVIIQPDLLARKQGTEEQKFTTNFSGIKFDESWEIEPPAAGVISASGILQWNPDWHSFITDTKIPAVITCKVNSCLGWQSFTKEIEVYPILDSKENRVRTFTAQTATVDYNTLVGSIEDPNKVASEASFFDGLGRNIQVVGYHVSPGGKDLVTLKVYDEFGREAVKNLPFSSNHSFEYRKDASTAFIDFYSNPPAAIAGDSRPFSETIFEQSPLNRPIKQFGVGQNWKDADKAANHDYLVNNINEVYLFRYNPSTSLLSWAGANSADGFYDAGQLYANKTTDEQGHEVIEYVDKEGRTVCKKVDASGSGNSKVYASTYYLYDDLGNLAVVLPPEGVKELTK
jgi:hypothetical protein